MWPGPGSFPATGLFLIITVSSGIKKLRADRYEGKNSQCEYCRNLIKLSGQIDFKKEIMQLKHKNIKDVLILRPLEKRIDASTAAEFKQKMGEWIDSGNRRIVLNLSEVDFIDSSGLGAIISGFKRIGNDGRLVICVVKESVMSLFRLTRMNRVFDIYASENEALDALSIKA